MRTPLRVLGTLGVLLTICPCARALDPSLDLSQYGHTSWRVRDGFPAGAVYAITQTPDGYLCLGTEFGLVRFDGVKGVAWQPPRYQNLPSPTIKSLLVARDGTLWIGTWKGLTSWKGDSFEQYHELDGLLTMAIAQGRNRAVWVAGFSKDGQGKLCRIVQSAVQCDAAPRLGNGPVSVFEDHTGTVWAGVLNGLWRWRLGPPMFFPLPGEPAGIQALAESEDGTLVLTMSGRLVRLEGGRAVTAYAYPSPATHAAAATMLRDRDGSFWIATLSAGLVHVHQGRADTFGRFEDLSGSNTYALFGDREATVWAGTTTGLDRFRNLAVTTLSSERGLTTSTTFAVATDGSVWQDAETALLHWADGTVTTYPKSKENSLAAAMQPLRLPQLIRNLAIDYTALSFVDPQRMHFRYRLEGQDSNWREVVNERQVQYSNLAPGAYRFRVIASNNSGVWNERGDALDFSIAPGYWQTLWFRALCLVALLGIGALIHWMRVRQLAFQFRLELDARVAERTRIARELHDTLLQNFQGVLMQFRAARRLLSKEPNKADEILASAIDQAAHAINEGRESVQGLRASTQESNNPATAIMRLSKELAVARNGGSTPTVQVEVEGSSRDLHPMIRDEVFRVAAEALRNAFQHSQGTRIEVELWYNARDFRLRVRDDGHGIDPKVLAIGGREGHFGLRGMRERAELVGGKLTVWSAPDSGAEIELAIPGSKAYAMPGAPDRSG